MVRASSRLTRIGSPRSEIVLQGVGAGRLEATQKEMCVEPLGESTFRLCPPAASLGNGSSGSLIRVLGARILGPNLPGKFDLQVSF